MSNEYLKTILGRIAEIEMGQSPESKYYNTNSVGLPLLQGNADIKERKSIKRIWTTKTTKECDEGDILMTVRAPVGKIGRAFFNACIGRGICAIKAKETNASYLYYLLLFHEESWQKYEQGSTFTAVGSKEVNNFPLNITTSLLSQDYIGNILKTCDAVIEKTQAAIAKYKAIKQGMLHDLFTRGIDVNTGKLRPKYEDAPELYKKSKLGWIPKEWEVKRLEQLCLGKPSYGINAPATEYNKQLPTYLRITDIDEDGNFISKERKCVDNALASQFILQNGDLVFARTGATVGKTYLYNEKDGILVYAGFLIKVSVKEEILDSYYLKQFTTTNYYYDWVRLMSQRSGQPGINGNEYANMELPKPIFKEQIIISKILRTINRQIENDKSYLYKMNYIKQALMNDLLSGKKEIAVL